MHIHLKDEKQIKIMAEGGAKLARVRDALYDLINPGVSAWDIELAAVRLIANEGAEASFKKVPGYHWATCINVNTGVVHGIPKKETIFEEDDVVSVDVGVYFKGFHTDTAVTKYLGVKEQKVHFLSVGRQAVKNAIKEAKVGNTIKDIAHAYESTLKKAGLNPIRSLTGHGVGRELHEDPYVPCFVGNSPEERVKIVPGMTLALEVMYTEGSGELKLDKDGWTLRTKDATIAALFEETVAVTQEGTLILTK